MKKIVLAGGGHGHINILKEIIKKPIPNCEITLITDFRRQYYSGMLPGFIEGIYTEDEISFNVPELCSRAGVEYVEDKIISIDKDNNTIQTENGIHTADIISINLGSLSNITFPIDSDDVCLVKPIKTTVDAKRDIEEKIKRDPNFKKLVFVGGGASGIELALAFNAAFNNLEIDIITCGEILQNFNNASKKKFYKLFEEKGINIIKHEYVKEIKDHKVLTENHEYDFDYAFITAGFRGPNVEFKSYETLDKNYLLVNDNLTASETSVAMGDTATLKCYRDMPKAGVFAIREAPILYKNLLKMINGESDYLNYKPQLKYLQIINCGDKKAIANYGNISFYGKFAWKIKDKIDRDYMIV